MTEFNTICLLSLNISYILSSLKTTNKSLYVTIHIIFLFRTHPERLVPVAVMMCLNGFESVFEYDLSYNCNETSSGYNGRGSYLFTGEGECLCVERIHLQHAEDPF